MASNGVILLHDNTRLHTANAVKTILQQFQWEMPEHPPYSSDLSPSDFPIFGLLKRAIRGHRFTTTKRVTGSRPGSDSSLLASSKMESIG
ncbi:histone-lysine N-methyltransferase SETMAR [Trichonephila clavipes]|nr:histone-lysine N-methyltransferase SETMAR [Trichonephila clavipes]